MTDKYDKSKHRDPAVVEEQKTASSLENDDRDEDVGYRKPPRKNQFKKGRSGNPKGRPKGSRNFTTDMHDELKKKVSITENGETREITKQLAIVKATVAKAASGDPRAIAKIVEIEGKIAATESADRYQIPCGADEQAIIDNFYERYAAQRKWLSAPTMAFEESETAGPAELTDNDKPGVETGASSGVDPVSSDDDTNDTSAVEAQFEEEDDEAWLN